jgi:hypothetical protein
MPPIEPGADKAVYDKLYQRYLSMFPRIADAPDMPVADNS